MNEASFDLAGASFVDSTVNVLHAVHPEHGDVNVLVHRAAFPEGKSLRDLAEGQVEIEAKRLRDFTVIGWETPHVAGLPALSVTSRFRREQGQPIYQRQTHLAIGATWMYFALMIPLPAREVCDAWLEAMLASLALRDEEPA